MSDWHPTTADLEILAEDGRSEAKSELVLHLLNCPRCWRAASDFLATLEARFTERGKTRAALWARDPATWCLLEKYRLEQASLEENLSSAAAVADVRRAGKKARKDAVARSRHLHRSGFVKGLLAEARATSVPYDAEEWAGLALVASQQIPPEAITNERRADLLAECFAELASARRRSARWIAASDALRQGNEHAQKGTGNPFVAGMLLAIEGLVEGDCGGLEKSDQLLTKASGKFSSIGALGYAAKAMVQVAYIYLDVDPEHSLQSLAVAEQMIPETNIRLAMFAESIRVDALISSGRTREAMVRFDALSTMYDQFGDPFVQLRRRFTAARLLALLCQILPGLLSPVG